MISDAAHRELRLACETAAPSSPAAEGNAGCYECGRSLSDPRGCDANMYHEQHTGGINRSPVCWWKNSAEQAAR